MLVLMIASYIEVSMKIWILLILSVEAGNIIVFDSMRNPKSAIQHIIDPLNR